MFSDHLKKIDEPPYKMLLWAAAGLVFASLLTAFAYVADGQVTKAKIREFQRNAEMQAIAQCMETYAGPARQSCIQQARVVAGTSVPPETGSTPKTEVLAGTPGQPGGVMASNGTSATVSSMLPPQGLMNASFAIR